MSDFAKLAAEAAEQYLAAIQKIQDTSLDTVARMASAVPDAAKNIPPLPTPEGLPTVAEVSEAYFDFTEKLIANQKAYTEKLLATVTPQT